MIKTKKILYCIIIILFLTIILSSCQLSPNVAYDNFITDLDILYRFEDIAFNIEFGRYSSIFQSDIKYIIRDLETLEIDDKEAVKINNKFLKSANAFLRASINYDNGSKDHAMVVHEYAKNKYEEALTAYYNFVVE